MNDRPVMITGVAGFIGSTLARKLLDQGRRVVGIDNFDPYYDPSRKRANVQWLLGEPNFVLCELDVRDGEAMIALANEHRPGVMAHLAAYANVRFSIDKASLYTHVNVVGSVNALEAAHQCGADNFVFASTSSVYGATDQIPFVETDPCNRPLAPYPASKKAIEVIGHSYHHLHGLNFTALRFFSVYGPRGRPDMMPFMVTDRIVRGETIKLFDGGNMKRDWTYVDDVVDGIIAAIEIPLGYEVFNLGRGEPVLMSDFVKIVEDLIGRKAQLETPPAPASEPPITYACIDKARRLLGYDPKTPVREGLARLWEWYQQEIIGGE